MKRIILITAVIATTCVGALAQAKPLTDVEIARGKEVIATIARWAAAVKDGDAKALDALFDEGVIVTHPDGKTYGKAQEIERLKPNPERTFISIKNDDMQVRVVGDAAIATAILNMQMKLGSQESLTRFRYTSVWILKDGRWQLAALHTSRGA